MESGPRHCPGRSTHETDREDKVSSPKTGERARLSLLPHYGPKNKRVRIPVHVTLRPVYRQISENVELHATIPTD